MRHLQWRTPLPPHIQCWCGTAAQNARVCEQRKFRKTDCSVCTPTLNIGARGLSCRSVYKTKLTCGSDLFSFHFVANYFPSTVKNTHCFCLARSFGALICCVFFEESAPKAASFICVRACQKMLSRAHTAACTHDILSAHTWRPDRSLLILDNLIQKQD